MEDQGISRHLKMDCGDLEIVEGSRTNWQVGICWYLSIGSIGKVSEIGKDSENMDDWISRETGSLASRNRGVGKCGCIHELKQR